MSTGITEPRMDANNCEWVARSKTIKGPIRVQSRLFAETSIATCVCLRLTSGGISNIEQGISNVEGNYGTANGRKQTRMGGAFQDDQRTQSRAIAFIAETSIATCVCLRLTSGGISNIEQLTWGPFGGRATWGIRVDLPRRVTCPRRSRQGGGFDRAKNL